MTKEVASFFALFEIVEYGFGTFLSTATVHLWERQNDIKINRYIF